MANKEKGEVEFEADGKTYTLRYSSNSLCEVEGLLNRGIIDIAGEMQAWGTPTDAKGKPLAETKDQATARFSRIRLTMVRAMFWAGLRDFHPHITITEAGDLIGGVGGMMGAAGLITQAMAASFPDNEEAKKPASPRKPGGPKAGTGSAS